MERSGKSLSFEKVNRDYTREIDQALKDLNSFGLIWA